MVNLWPLSYVSVCDCVFGLGLCPLTGTEEMPPSDEQHRHLLAGCTTARSDRLSKEGGIN